MLLLISVGGSDTALIPVSAAATIITGMGSQPLQWSLCTWQRPVLTSGEGDVETPLLRCLYCVSIDEVDLGIKRRWGNQRDSKLTT